MMPASNTADARRQRGATLVEALVALLVLSIGLLGVAALQMEALRSNHGAHLRSQATVLAQDIADRMRANRTAALAGAYDIALGANPAGAALSDLDLTTWKDTLADILPAGDGAVALAGNVATITVQWTDRLGTDTFTTETEL
ncbi:MAG: type IV pilus modification protein PilV [Steroidobacteraceae bacterium]|nr:type IV pilus modification protein PilV [Steroidobacteraceae bacterium]